MLHYSFYQLRWSAAFFTLLFLTHLASAAPVTDSFTDSQGLTTLYRYSLKAQWDKHTPRGALIYFHGNNDITQTEILDMFFWSVEQQAYQRDLIPIVVTSPKTRDDGITRHWYSEDKQLIHELLQGHFKQAFALDFNRILFSGGSQGTCFLHDFMMAYGEQYGGGFYGGCGCYNAPNPVWTPSATFKNRFKVFVHATTEDFLFETSQNGYAYYKYTLGFETRADLSRSGTHCSVSHEVEGTAYDWLLGLTDIPDVPFQAHWKRIATLDNLKGMVIEKTGDLLVLQQTATNQASLWRSQNQGQTWDLIQQFNDQAKSLQASGNTIWVGLASGLYSSADKGVYFQLIYSDFSGAYAVDAAHRLYGTGRTPLMVSDDAGKNWTYLKNTNNHFLFTFFLEEYLTTLNPDLFVASGANDNLQYVSTNQGQDWQRLNDTADGAPFSVAGDGTTLWSLAAQNYYYRLFKSTDQGNSWTAVNLPASMNEYFYGGARVAVLDSGEIWLFGGGNSAWNSQDQGQSWTRVYGAETLSYGSLFPAPNQQLYASNGHGIFSLLRQPEATVTPELTAGADWQRFTHWAESTFPQFFSANHQQDFNSSAYLVRYYADSDIYLGYNVADQHVYGYSLSWFGPNLQDLGLLAGYLMLAQQTGF